MIRRDIAWRNRNTSNPACAGSSSGQTWPDTASLHGQLWRVMDRTLRAEAVSLD
jgi:hypothetical protein